MSTLQETSSLSERSKATTEAGCRLATGLNIQSDVLVYGITSKDGSGYNRKKVYSLTPI